MKRLNQKMRYLRYQADAAIQLDGMWIHVMVQLPDNDAGDWEPVSRDYFTMFMLGAIADMDFELLDGELEDVDDLLEDLYEVLDMCPYVDLYYDKVDGYGVDEFAIEIEAAEDGFNVVIVPIWHS